MSEKTVRLKPSRKAWFWWYVLGIVLIPLLGAGIYMLYRLYQTHKSINYVISDRSITASDSKISEKTDLANIRNIDLRQTRTDKKFDIADLIIHTSGKTVELLGMENPEALSSMILKAAESERQRLAALQKKEEPRPEPSKPGTMDKMDYLTGLWQQGLITNEEFEQEKKHFE
ncbi:MAG: PH domain-containing protein [Balneolaceae bacterium]